ncbi:Smr/MutS family protein [Acidocella sp.]|uniref:Smr/MutS family protein n=1 Tax=Acidocella sp. TaxID=50710 RepID=UPI002620AED2|nr:Smr/MutS family protein [Acidocella sp.]
MSRRKRELSAEDQALWAAYGRTLTRLMPGRARLLPPPPEPPPVPPAPTRAHPPEPRVKLARAPLPLAPDAAPAGLDKSTWAKFRAQKIRAEARLDLHGHTATRAHTEVRQFLETAHGLHMRCVEIITGQGEVIARELPHWLNAPGLRPLILAISHPHARNRGAVRVLLRRIRA